MNSGPFLTPALLEQYAHSFYPDLLSAAAAVASQVPGSLSDFLGAQASPARIIHRQAERSCGSVARPGISAYLVCSPGPGHHPTTSPPEACGSVLGLEAAQLATAARCCGSHPESPQGDPPPT